MPPSDRQARVLVQLNRLKVGKSDALKDLFWTELGYERVGDSLSVRNWTPAQRAPLAQDPVIFAEAARDADSGGPGFQVIYCRLDSDRLPLTGERIVVSRLLPEHPYSLFVFSNRDQTRWHFLNVKQDDDVKRRRLYRRISVGPEERLRTASERLALIAIDSVKQTGLWGPSRLDLQLAHDEAFDVEKVTKQFFKEYQARFRALRDDLQAQTGDAQWAHDYALQFLNRLMFLYFVQRKRWLGDDPQFLDSFWRAYRRSGQPRDSFVERWLHVMFFEAFNNRYHGGHKQFPEAVHEALSTAPFLNGGLFKRNDLDTRHRFHITDACFEEIKKFLDGYNFTIAEDSPLDQEVAVDPEMIGKVYESLVNAAEKEATGDRRGDAGIFYTPRTEIDLMCRLALVDNLANHLGQDRKDLLYELVFALEPEEKARADAQLARKGLWPVVQQYLQEITVVDPACGSGSFLVGMLYILNDLLARAEAQIGATVSAYERKTEIIGRSLYGVDVMTWACHVAELRLWLALIIDADFTPAELHVRKEPLLPHFTFHIRCGDSLVEEVGGVNLAYVHTSGLSSALKAKITRHRIQKACFYHNDEDCEYKTPEQAQQEELRLFRAIMDEQDSHLGEQITELRRKISGPQAAQMRLDGSKVEKPHQMQLQAQEWERQVDALTEERARLQEARQALRTVHDVPFVWNIAFVEIFEGDRQGFDLVIGNPPYVRQEKIADPRLSPEEVTAENKREYKAKLARAAYESFPGYFGYSHSRGEAARKLQAKNDLYVYFYLRGLRLLNPQGTFCFITSNSWLDVGYGADLQEFLLRQSQVRLVIDNQVKRSFQDADVNTVIVLLPAPSETANWGLDKTARFVMFLVPFEHILPLEPRESGAAVVFEELEAATGRKVTPEYRLNALPQARLLEEGLEKEEESEESAPRRRQARTLVRAAKYTGNKWGGKYLRAPDIYWTILEKAGDRLVRLGDIADVRRGFTTGCNEFFYLPSKHFGVRRDGDYYRLIPKHEGLPEGMAIEAEYLRPVVKSPTECTRIVVKSKDIHVRILVCRKRPSAIKGQAVYQYIQWGEHHETTVKQGTEEGQSVRGFHRLRSLEAREHWYDVGVQRYPQIAWIKTVNDSHRQSLLPADSLVDQRLYEITTEWPAETNLILNSFLTMLMKEMVGRVALGQGALDTAVNQVQDLLVLDPRLLIPHRSHVDGITATLSARNIGAVASEAVADDRRELDDLVVGTLGLTRGEGDALRQAVVDLVAQRLDKANSV